MKAAWVLGVGALFLVSGCKSMQERSVDRKGVGLSATVITWDSARSAAVAMPGDRVCLQNAVLGRDTEVDVMAKVTEAAISWTKVLQPSMPSKGSGSGEFVTATTNINRSVTRLDTSTERTAFLSLGLFYVCQIAANQKLGEAETSLLVRQMMTTAAGL